MRIIDRRSLWIAFAMLLFAAAMASIHYLQHGISKDFGLGFSVGLIVGGTLALTAVGWRRGELRREDRG